MAAGGSGSIAKELFKAIKLRDFCEYVNKLNKADIMTPKEFAVSIYAQDYDLDTRICYHERRINKDHMYDIFSDFSGTDMATAKEEMLKEITENYDWYESRGRVVLNLDGLDLSLWLSKHFSNKTTRADELALYALSHLYNRHTVVFGKNRPWCTIRPTGDPKEADFVNSCHVHLLYIGVSMFAPLKPRVHDVPQHVSEYLNTSNKNWAQSRETNYTAYYNEDEYSDYVEVIGEKRIRSSSRTCKHRVSSTVTSTSAPDLGNTLPMNEAIPSISYSGQPVFPGESDYSITYHFDAPPTTSSNIEHIVTISNSTLMRAKSATSITPNELFPANVLANGPVNDVVEILDEQVGLEPNTPGEQNESNREVAVEINQQDTQAALITEPSIITTDPVLVCQESTDTESIKTTPDSEKHYMIEQDRDCVVKLCRLDQSILDKYMLHTNYDMETEELSVNTEVETDHLEHSDTLIMTLRPRKERRVNRTHHTTAKPVDYRHMDVDSDAPDPPNKPQRKYQPRSGPSKARLRAQRLVKKQRAEEGMNSSNTDETDKTDPDSPQKQDPAQRADDKAEEAYHGDTEDDDQKQVKPKGKLVTTKHGIRKRPKKIRKFRCKICDNIFGSTKEWNKHYESSHPLIPCTDCDKVFRNPTSLYRHRYVHTKVEGIHPCEKCDKTYPFRSQLTSHMFSHRKVSHFPCTYDGCKKVFKTDWNRRAHEKSHENEPMQCPKCDYVTTDNRYLKQHSRVHEDTLKYCCEKCNMGFRFYEQKKRHVSKDCQTNDNS